MELSAYVVMNQGIASGFKSQVCDPVFAFISLQTIMQRSN